MAISRIHKGRAAFLCAGAILMLAGAALVMSGCGSSQSSANGPSVLTYSEQSDPSAIDPALANESVGQNIDHYLYEGLVKYDPTTGEAKPALAQSWDVNSDATVFTFHLKPGTKFSDGQEVTADDFVYAWTRALSPAMASPTAQEILGQIKGAADLAAGKTDKLAGVKAVDKDTLKVTLKSPMAEFPVSLGHPVCSPVPKAEAERQDVKYGDAPVGNGPFVIKEWVHNDHITLEKNPNYEGDAPKVDKVVMKVIPDPATAVSELKAGHVDIVKGVDPGQMQSLRDDGSVHLYQEKSNQVKLIGFNTTKSPFDNLKLRQAIALLIDRKTMADKVLQGQSYPADGYIPTSIFGYQGGVMPDYSPDKAKSLLVQAGFPGGKGLPALTLTYVGVPQAADAAQAIQASLKSAGIPCEIKSMDQGAFLDAMQGGQLGMFMVSWQEDSPGLDGFLQPLFHSSNIGATNVFNYSNPDVDRLIDQARATPDATRRNNDYNQAERQIMADAPAIPVVFGQDVLVCAPRVTNFIYSPLGDLALDQISVSNS